MSWLNKSFSRSVSSGHYDVAALKGDIVDKVSAAIMMIDRDFVVTYVNGPTRELLRKNAAAFAAMWPGFDPEQIVGRCIDMFHKNPAHQRQMLSDPSRLPIRTEITIGDLKIALLVNGCFDARGNYVGNVLEWQDVTTTRLNEGILASINKMQAVIEFDTQGKIPPPTKTSSMLGLPARRDRGQHHRCSSIPPIAQSGIPGILGQAGARRVRRQSVQAHRQGRQGSLDPGQLQPDPGCHGQALQGGEVCNRRHCPGAGQQMQEAVRQTQDIIGAAKENDLTQRIPLQGKTGEIEALCARRQ